MSKKPVSPLRQRLIDDMTARRFSEDTKRDYVRNVRKFAAFLGRSPDTATSEDLRRFQLHMAQQQVGPSTINAAIAALRFFFTVTLEKPDLVRPLRIVNEPRKAPVVLSQEEVARLLQAAPGLKYKAALSVAYGAGLRVSEVAHLKVSDIDSERMMLRVEQGKGQRDRDVMLSPQLLQLLREWWKAARPQVWLFPGQNPMNPVTARQLNRAVAATKDLAANLQARFSPYASPQLCDPPLLEQGVDIRVIQVLLGHAKLETTALYTRVAVNTVRDIKSPLDRLDIRLTKKTPPACPRPRGAASPRGRRRLSRPRGGVAKGQRRSREPRPAEGHVGDRDLSHSRARRPRRALRGLRARAPRIQFLPQSPLPEVPSGRRAAMARRSRGGAPAGSLLSRGLHPAGRDRRRRVPEQGGRLRPPVQDRSGDADHDRRRPEASGRAHRPHRRAAHLGLGADPPSARPRHRARRRPVAGRFSLDRLQAWLLPAVRVLSRLFRRLFLDGLAALHAAGRLAFLGDLAPLADKPAFDAAFAPLRRSEW